MKRFSIVAVIASLVIILSCSKTTDNNSLNTTDQNFMVMATYSNYDEIDFGNLALSKSANDSVKMLASRMVTDHTIALTTLKDTLGPQYNLTLPSSMDSLHMAIQAQINTYTGVQFDTAYVHGQVRDHMATIALFENEINNGNNENIKAFANKNLPILQMHLQMAESVAATLP